MKTESSHIYSAKELQLAFVQHLHQFINENTISFTLTTKFDLTKVEIHQQYSKFIHRLSSYVYKKAYSRSKKSGNTKLLHEIAVVEQAIRIVAMKGSGDLNTHVHGVINLPDWYVAKHGTDQFMQFMKDTWWHHGISDIHRQKDIDGNWAEYVAKKSTKTDGNYSDSILLVN